MSVLVTLLTGLAGGMGAQLVNLIKWVIVVRRPCVGCKRSLWLWRPERWYKCRRCGTELAR